MKTRDRHVIVLAAGRGTRMRSQRPKVLHQLAGRSLIERVIRAARTIGPATTTVVVGHQAALVQAALGGQTDLRFVRQEPQLGTAHALLQADAVLAGVQGTLVVLSGDVPRLSPATLTALLTKHEADSAAATVLTAKLERPFGYGRVIRVNGELVGIVEETDATPQQRTIREINGGVYAFDIEPLFEALNQIPEAGPKRERYLPALVPMYRRQRLTVGTVTADDPNEIRGINSQTELAEVSAIVRQSKNEELMAAGVTLEDPSTTYIDDDVTVGADTVIRPGVRLEGRTTVGARCELQSWVRVVDSTIADDVTVRNCCVISESQLESGTSVGPFAHLRPGSVLHQNARVGNFVELKQTALGAGSKANHLSYIGDSSVGSNVNVGAGTITCNYDGAAKHRTTIEDGVFIGSGSQLVAPLTLGKDSYVAAGSCVTADVPPGALGMARARQENKEGWVEKKRKSE
jgi:bifunctional UDP-N-acetylglucosamine pyrophosphorylase/glucosamine-1-phosphate N-acetyltransferase